MMQSYRHPAPIDRNIVRFRCYVCGERCWDYLEDVSLNPKPGHNTIICLCDSCEEEMFPS